MPRPSPVSCRPNALVALCLVALSWPRGAMAQDAAVDFVRAVQPILAEHCAPCHGPDPSGRKGKVRLDVRAEAVAAGAVVPGQPGQSRMVARITHADPARRMPPPGQRPLTAAQIATLTTWVAQGAPYAQHWAWQPPVRPPLPAVRAADWCQNPVDRFVLARLEAQGLAPLPAADRATLLRRLSLDLLGLPPTPAEVAAFVADAAPDAYARQVERLLASPHHGERLAVWWLDLARFADTVGFHGDQGQNVFPYRDWVVDAFHRNLPFDQFTRDQMAGDLLPDASEAQRTATGFLRLNMMTREGGAQPREYLTRYTADRVRTLAGAWLGVTIGCAECHDHKMDPFRSRDFYRLGAFFADLRQWGVYQDYPYTPNADLKNWSNDHPFPPELRVASSALQRRMASLEARRDALVAAAARDLVRSPERAAAFADWCAQTRAFQAQHPDGFEAPAPRLRPPPRGKPGTPLITVADDGSVAFADGAPTTVELEWSGSARSVAAVALELLPDPARGHRSLRAEHEASTLRVSLRVLAPGGAPRSVPLRCGDADAKDPRYFNGHELVGIGAGWRPARARAQDPQRGVWLLATPVALTAADTLQLQLDGCGATRLRVALAPTAPARPTAPVWDDRGRAALTATVPDGPALELLVARWLRSSAGDASAGEALRALDLRHLECGDGRAPTLVAEAVATPMPCRVLPRGNWQDESGEPVLPGVPEALPTSADLARPGDRRLTRLDLARWLTAPEQPLTARVVSNRLWQLLFGVGLTATVDDLGTRGELPSHPELLDWLAVEFRASGWDLRHLLRLMVGSAAYQQRVATPADAVADPGGRLLRGQRPRRLDAEFVRDNALRIAGLLELEVGGPSATPYQPPGYYRDLQFPDRDYRAESDERQYRRGLYMHWQRTFLHPMLAAFDAPSREECTPVRSAANTPQQALTLLDDPTFVEAARALAADLLAAPADDDARLLALYQRALLRAPRAGEWPVLRAALARERHSWRARPAARNEFLRVGRFAAPGLDPDELAAWTSVARVVLNLHETITRY